jgi:uncharacterized membrane protein YgdD (TMEM256/DUF423 family)
MKTKTIITWAGVLGVIAVTMGAMGAHALKAILTEESLQSFLTGTRYNMYHALALIGLISLQPSLNEKYLRISTYCFTIGTVLFSGSIYLLSTSSITGLAISNVLGPITPIGGLVLITGWFSIILGALRFKS